MNIIKFRIFLWLALVALTGWILWMNVVPSGRIIYLNDFSEEESEFVRKLTPDERLLPIADGVQKIIGEPVYFDLRMPRRFTHAKLTMKYKNNTNLPIVAVGVLMDKKMQQYFLEPVENKILDDLLEGWLVIREDDLVLLQRPNLEADKNFASLADFKNNLPAREKIALYNTDLKNEYLLPDYEADSQERDLGVSLRGAYQFYTYIKDEDLNFTFNFIDVNEYGGSDDISINLYYQDQMIDSVTLADDGVVDDQGILSEARELKLFSAGLPEGVYRVEVRGSNDIITSSLKTSQQKISFLNKIWLSDSTTENLKIFTDVSRVAIETIDPNSLQKILADGEELDVAKTYEQYSLPLGAGVKEIDLVKGGVILSGNGIFSLSEAEFFNPQYRRLDEDFNPDVVEIDYILARYHPPTGGSVADGEWLTATAEFDLSNAYQEFSKQQFLLSIPGLRTEDGVEDYLEVDEIKIELTGTSLREKILSVFR